MKKISTIFCIGAIALLAASCDLDLAPKGSITYNEGDPIIETQADLDGYEVNIMYCLRALEYSYFDYVSDIQMDYFNYTVSAGNNVGNMYDGDFTASDYYPQYCWDDCYVTIKNFNFFLKGSTEVPDGIDAHIARGEAFFGRAFAYLFLARHFGLVYNPSTAETDLCVPLVLEYNINERPARATVKEVYDQIRSDLDSAYVNLQEVTGEVRAQKPTVDAVNCLYARYYLDTRDYTNAAATAKGVIDTGTYALSADEDAMEQEWLYDNGTEPILQYYASQSEGTGSHSCFYYEYIDNDGSKYIQEYYCPCARLVNAYSASDLRFKQWFNTELAIHGSNYYNQGTVDYYHFCKYTGNPNLLTVNYNTSAQAKKAFLISEQYLIAAEAYHALGDDTNAATYLNGLQSARKASTTEVSDEAIKTEWYRETVGEGLRLSCLKRWGDGYDGRPVQYTDEATTFYGHRNGETLVYTPGDYRFNWPMPTYEMQTNANLIQNPGYASSGSSDEDDEE